jgi:hypothetical protein
MGRVYGVCVCLMGMLHVTWAPVDMHNLCLVSLIWQSVLLSAWLISRVTVVAYSAHSRHAPHMGVIVHCTCTVHFNLDTHRVITEAPSMLDGCFPCSLLAGVWVLLFLYLYLQCCLWI